MMKTALGEEKRTEDMGGPAGSQSRSGLSQGSRLVSDGVCMLDPQ